ncbi:hypothetical protein ACQKPX_20840 [Photobacterium sp. DNB23_23_1]
MIEAGGIVRKMSEDGMGGGQKATSSGILFASHRPRHAAVELSSRWLSHAVLVIAGTSC